MMQQLARLAEINREMFQLAEEASRILSNFDGESRRAAGQKQSDRWLNTKQAMRLSRVDSSSTVYRWGRRYGVGEKTAAGWRFSERAIRNFLAVEKSADGENGENGDADQLPLATDRAHTDDELERLSYDL